MAYQFPLESILKHRKRQEEVAHREFVEARVRLEECLSGIDRMYERIDSTRVAISEAENHAHARPSR